MLRLICNILLKTTCGFVWNSHLNVGAQERIEVPLSELAFVLETAKGCDFCQ